MVILEKKIDGVSQSALERFLGQARQAVKLRGRVNVLIAGNPAIRSLNLEFRKKNKPTDVLSFPTAPAPSGAAKSGDMAGEIAISADIALQNSLRLGHPVSAELKILILHGLLHLAGFDHERDNGAMARKEDKLRRTLRLPVALIERTATEPASARGAASRNSRRTA